MLVAGGMLTACLMDTDTVDAVKAAITTMDTRILCVHGPLLIGQQGLREVVLYGMATAPAEDTMYRPTWCPAAWPTRGKASKHIDTLTGYLLLGVPRNKIPTKHMV